MPNKYEKRKLNKQHDIKNEEPGEDLFVDAPPDDSDDDNDGGSDDDDTTDTEESEYSGLEEEEDDDEDEEEEDDSDSDDDSTDLSSEEGTDEKTGSDKSNEEEKTKDKANNNATNDAGPNVATNLIDNVKKKKNKTNLKKKPRGEMTEPKTEAEKLDNANKTNEYEQDSSDEEDLRNTVGNIPMEWYKELAHIGYDLEGKPIAKPEMGDQLDEFLNKMDNPDYWRTVHDKMTGQNVRLSDADVELIQRMKAGKYVDPSYDPYKPWIDFFTFEKMTHPLTNQPRTKASFIPSRWERLKVGRLVHAMKMGWIKPRPPPKGEEEKEEEDPFYQLWKDDDQTDITKRYRDHIPAPKLALPGHAESYNPPPEYLMTEEEELAWKNKDPDERRQNFIPKKYDCLRKVPGYSMFINERFQRCLDLYLCPRQRKVRMNLDPEDLIPKLPKPKDLQPFPSVQSIIYRGHTSLIRSVSVEPGGQWLVSGSDDGTVKFWEVATGRCMKTLKVGGVVKCVSWNPNASFSLVAAAVEENVIIINPGLNDKLVCSNTDNMIQSYEEDTGNVTKLPVEWNTYEGQQYDQGFRLRISHAKKLQEVVWHGRGDYFAVVQPEADSMAVLLHQLSRRRSQNPFKKSKGLVQCVAFHPTRPFLVVATQRYARVYNLLKQEMAKKLVTNCKWVSSLAIHPGGDNVIIGSYDCKLNWFDLDLSNQPYQTLRHHKKAIRHVAFHRRYPLFASASDDGSVIVCHGKVFNDLLQNPLIVPVKVLRGHEKHKDLGVLCCIFHPTQPWLFSSAADNTIRLFT